MGAMMNLRAAQAWKTVPQIMAIGAAFGNKDAAAELRMSLSVPMAEGRAQAQALIEQLKIEGTKR